MFNTISMNGFSAAHSIRPPNGISAALQFELYRAIALKSFWFLTLGGLTLHLAGQAAMAFILAGMRGDGVLNGSSLDIATLIVGKGPILPLTAALLATLLVGQEYRYGSRTYAVTLAGSRGRFVAAKLLGVGICAAMVALLGILGCTVIATNSLLMESSEITMGFIFLLTGRFFSVLGWSLIATYLVLITHSQILTVALLLAVPFVVEGSLKAAGSYLGGIAADVSHFFPFAALEAITPSGDSAMFTTPGLPPIMAAGIALVYMAIAALLAIRRA